jgi:hypothetical protein
MSDLLLDEFNDISLIDGKASLIEDGNKLLAQKVELRMKTYYGEWYRNYTLGVPYFESILKKGVELSFVDAIFKDVIKSTSGVNRVVSYKSSLSAGGEYLASFTFTANDGDLISLTTQIEI